MFHILNGISGVLDLHLSGQDDMSTYGTVKSVKCIKHTSSSFREKPYCNILEDISLLPAYLNHYCVSLNMLYYTHS